ncbi:MAG: hypothetical protein AVDCRST_MAG73-1838, partial [uncultured Thermomicrobiales bacterium]
GPRAPGSPGPVCGRGPVAGGRGGRLAPPPAGGRRTRTGGRGRRGAGAVAVPRRGPLGSGRPAAPGAALGAGGRSLPRLREL